MMPTSTTQRPQGEGTRPAGRMRKAERKKQLLAHAKQLFMELGYHATTTEKIANAAGVSEPVLYRHFESKKALFVEVLHEIRQATLERWNSEISRLSDPLAKLPALSNMYVSATRSQPEDLRVIHRTFWRPTIQRSRLAFASRTWRRKKCCRRSSWKANRQAYFGLA